MFRRHAEHGDADVARRCFQFDSDKGYKAALLSTLKRTRELIAEGKL